MDCCDCLIHIVGVALTLYHGQDMDVGEYGGGMEGKYVGGILGALVRTGLTRNGL